MSLRRIHIVRSIILLLFLAFSQENLIAQPVPSVKQIRRDSTLNQLDRNRRKTGLWMLRSPARRGEPEIVSLGHFEAGEKTGTWYQIDSQGDLIAIENFRHDILNGEVKYYHRGQLYCTGNYLGIMPRYKSDTIVVTHPITQAQHYVAIPREKKVLKHGFWNFFDEESGQLVKEEVWFADELLTQKKYRRSSVKDSLYRERHLKNLPHVKGKTYDPPRGKSYSLTE